jgi:hypothetical protein
MFTDSPERPVMFHKPREDEDGAPRTEIDSFLGGGE